MRPNQALREVGMKIAGAWRLNTIVMFLLVSSLLATAQLFPGRITGTVRDVQGAAITGAAVKLSNPATGRDRSLVTDQNGEFNFPELSLGSFELTVSKEGFRTTLV